jgi:hypothetical protein
LLSKKISAFATAGKFPRMKENMNPKTIKCQLAIPSAVLLLLTTTAAVQAQFDYTVNADNTVNITGYTGPPWAVTIPTNINGLTVTTIGQSAFTGPITLTSLTSVTMLNGLTSIGEEAFYGCTSLDSVTIPASITNIGIGAFDECTKLTNAAISNGVTSIGESAFIYCSSVASVVIPGSITNFGPYAFSDCTSLTNATISAGATNIGYGAFYGCSALTSLTIPGSVTSIGDDALENCTSLASVFFTGNAPAADSTVFAGDNSNPVMYYLLGTTGWSSPFASRQALLWNPIIQASGTNFGVSNNQFGFNITGTAYISVVVEACTNLANPVWARLLPVMLTNGLFYFSDGQWTNYPSRYYRINSP